VPSSPSRWLPTHVKKVGIGAHDGVAVHSGVDERGREMDGLTGRVGVGRSVGFARVARAEWQTVPD
jgi:hypothetical protein